jgi:hypothetical protein
MITPQIEGGQIVGPRTLTNSTVDQRSNPLVVGWVPVRQGSQEHEDIPSRFGDRLEYRDGRVKELSA